MKNFFLIAVLSVIFYAQPTYAIEKQSVADNNCVAVNLKNEIKSIWFVPKGQSAESKKIYFSDAVDGVSTQKYIIAGDLLIANNENTDAICASYVQKGKVTTFGWIKKTEIEKFELVSFGALETPESKKSLKKSYSALAALAKRLPDVHNWKGDWEDVAGNSVNLWKKGAVWELDTTYIKGADGTGDKNEDSQPIKIKGAMVKVAGYYSDNAEEIDVCNIVIVAFNNAILATSGSHCMGSGANHEYPEFNGIYWKK